MDQLSKRDPDDKHLNVIVLAVLVRRLKPDEALFLVLSTGL